MKISMIGIIGAMRVEIEGLCSLIDKCVVKKYNNKDFYTGYINNVGVVVVECGIGKVNAAITASILCEKFNIDYIINTGLAGGINVNTFDMIIGDKLVYHDFDITALSYKKGVIPNLGKEFETDKLLKDISIKIAKEKGIPYHVGNIASGDLFATNINILDGLDMDIKAVEMEGCAIAHTAKIFNKPFIVLRVISDILNSNNQSASYNEVEKKAADYAIIFVFEIIKKLVLTK